MTEISVSLVENVSEHIKDSSEQITQAKYINGRARVSTGAKGATAEFLNSNVWHPMCTILLHNVVFQP